MEKALIIILVAYSVHALIKPIFFFALPYRTRRAALDKSYDGRASATRTSDTVLLLLCLLLAGLLWARGADPLSFLVGLLVGMTLIQLFFHRFSEEPPEERQAPAPTSPIKQMSYAIQDRPGRAWKELLLISVLLLWSLGKLLADRLS